MATVTAVTANEAAVTANAAGNLAALMTQPMTATQRDPAPSKNAPGAARAVPSPVTSENTAGSSGD